MKVGDGLSDEARSCTVHGTKGYLEGRSKLVHVNRAKDDRRFLPVTLINLQFMAKQAR